MFPHYLAKNLFFAELVNKTLTLPTFAFFLLFIINGFLIWLIGKKLFDKKYQIFPILAYLFSPWFYYLALGHSYYFYLLSPILLGIYGIIELEKSGGKRGNILTLVGLTIAVYSSLLSIIFLPILLILKKFRIFLWTILLLLPLLIIAYGNKLAFKNTLNRELLVFSDPGIVNTANRFQGAAAESGLKPLARLSENKYIFYSEYFLLKYTDQLVPVTFFTPQYRLLGFSFTPPIFLGLLIPFLYGLYTLILKSNTRKFLLISTILTIPSVIGKDLVSLNRLILFSPVIVFIIISGLIHIFKLENKKLSRILFISTIFLVIFQLFITLGDIKMREKLRFESYFGNNYEMVEQ
jgi:hypothetical protein